MGVDVEVLMATKAVQYRAYLCSVIGVDWGNTIEARRPNLVANLGWKSEKVHDGEGLMATLIQVEPL